MTAAGIATTAKHFSGLGRVVGNTDNVAGVVDPVTTETSASLRSFRAAIGSDVQFVMVALATYAHIDPAHLAVFSTIDMHLLRARMGFDGVIVSDDLGAATAVAQPAACGTSNRLPDAGGDLIVSKSISPTVAMAKAVVARASTRPRFRARVDDATRQVLAAKDASGLLPCSSGKL
jgi:beta-N-acetylhexosaminidase